MVQDLPGNRGKLLGFEFTEKYRAEVYQIIFQRLKVRMIFGPEVFQKTVIPRQQIESSEKSRRQDYSKKGGRCRNPENRFLPEKVHVKQFCSLISSKNEFVAGQ